MRRLFLVPALVLACFASSCASGPVAGTSALAHDAGALVVDALPPGFHSVGELALNALIALSESQGWTKEQFAEATQVAYKATSAAPALPRAEAAQPDEASKERAAKYIKDIAARAPRGR